MLSHHSSLWPIEFTGLANFNNASRGAVEHIRAIIKGRGTARIVLLNDRGALPDLHSQSLEFIQDTIAANIVRTELRFAKKDDRPSLCLTFSELLERSPDLLNELEKKPGTTIALVDGKDDRPQVILTNYNPLSP